MNITRIPKEIYHEILVPSLEHVDFNNPFPHGGATDDQRRFSGHNIKAVEEFQRLQDDPRIGLDHTRQLPPTIGISCSRIDLPAATQGQVPGEIFVQAVRGGRASPKMVQSVNYGLLLPSKKRPHIDTDLIPVTKNQYPEKFVCGVVHGCNANGQECRGRAFSELEEALVKGGDPLIHMKDLKGEMLQRGIIYKDVPGTAQEDVDTIHAHNRARMLLSKIPDLVAGLAEGSVLLGEGVYQEGSGDIKWTRFWHTAKLPAYSGVLPAVVDGLYEKKEYLDGYPQHIQTLNSIVHGNRSFQGRFAKPAKAEAVLLTCADSRVANVFDSPLGLIESIRVAGSVIDPIILRSFRIACENAVSNVESRTRQLPGRPKDSKPKALAIFLGHTKCGAVEHTLECISKGDPDCLQDAKFGALSGDIAQRLRYYTQEHPDYEHTDKFLAAAADANAAGSLIDALFQPDNPDSATLRELVLNDKLDLVIARHSIKTHVVQMNPPIGSTELKRLMPYF